MNTRSDLFINIAIGFVIGAFFVLLASGPEMWLGAKPEGFLAFIG